MITTDKPKFSNEWATVYADHEGTRFWYVPKRISFARREDRAVFSFVRYRRADSTGGGFLVFEVNMQVPDEEVAVLRKGANLPESVPLIPITFDSGTVRAFVLNATSDPGSTNQKLVQKLVGAARPSLLGANSAIFAAELDEDGATLLEQVMRGGQALLGVAYDLKYRAMHPPLNVSIKANSKQVYDAFSADLKGQYSFLKGEVGTSVENMRKNRVLDIQTIDTIGDADSKATIDNALAYLKDFLLGSFFTPVMVPGKPAVSAIAEELDAVLARKQKIDEMLAKANDAEKKKLEAERAQLEREIETLKKKKEEGSTGGGDSVANAAGQVINLLNEGSTQALSGATGMPVISFSLKSVHQIEQIEISGTFTAQRAGEVMYAPQGFIGFSRRQLEQLEDQRYFVDATLDDPFWQTFGVDVYGPLEADYTGYGVHTASVQVTYPGAAPRPPVRFARGDAAPKNVNWPFVKGSESFEALMNYSFDRTWDALPSAATFTVQRAASRVREVHVTPHEDLTFLLVRPEFVEPLDWKVLQRVQLTLEYTDRAGNSARKVFDYTEAQNGPYEWRLRVHEKNAAPEYRWSLRFFRRGRTEAAVTIDAQTASGVTLPLPNPFAPRHVVVRLGRAVKIADFDLITVELTYGDPKSRPVTASMTFDESNAAPQKWTLAVPEDGPNEYRWRAVFFRDGQESETAGTAKFAGPTSLLLLNAPE